MTEEVKPPALLDHNELMMRRLQVHLAEYNALSTRLTYWINLQYVTYVIAAAGLGFIGQAWGHVDSRQLAWASILILLFVVWALAQTNFEIFTYVAYIETRLRPQFKLLAEDNESLLGFEQYLSVLRAKRFISFEQNLGLIPLFICGGAVSIFIIVRSSLNTGRTLWISNGVWCACCIYILVMTILKFRYSLALQRTIFRAK